MHTLVADYQSNDLQVVSLPRKSEIMHPFRLRIGSLIIEASILGKIYCQRRRHNGNEK